MNLKEEISKYGILNIIGAIADENNIKAYAVGGFVRDFLLNIESPKTSHFKAF